MEILLMNINDYSEVYKLWTNTYGMGLRSLDDSASGIAKFLARNPNTNFICKIDNKIVGVIMCGHDGRRGYIYHAAVNEHYRRKGIGKALVEKVLNVLKEEGINKVALVVYDKNIIGNDFWVRLGFSSRNDLVYRNLSLNNLNI